MPVAARMGDKELVPPRQVLREPAPLRTDHPVRQVVVFLGITYAIRACDVNDESGSG